ncbi:9254_t:CDS:2, partial [Paraglomus occultum]
MDPFSKKGITPNDVCELLDNVSNALPSWTHWNGYNIPPPILVIDEANKFSQLEQFGRGGNSSQINSGLDVLYIPHATPYVVGDLSKEEAEEYFEVQVLPRYECKELKGKFDHVRKMTGTRMLIIDRYVGEYKNYGGKFKDSTFSVYISKYDKLKRGLYTYTERLRHSDKPNPALWKDYDLIKTMEAIVKAENQGYILEDDLIKEIGSGKVDSLVDYNFLHCRPTTLFANDITDPPDEASPEPTLSVTMYNLQDTESVEHRKGNGRPSKITQTVSRAFEQHLHRNMRMVSSRPICDDDNMTYAQRVLTACATTTRQLASKVQTTQQISMLTEQHIEGRKAWAEAHLQIRSIGGIRAHPTLAQIAPESVGTEKYIAAARAHAVQEFIERFGGYTIDMYAGTSACNKILQSGQPLVHLLGK